MNSIPAKLLLDTAVPVVVMLCVKVYLKSQFIMNGVCVIWRGWIDLQRLDGTARLEFDEQRASVRTHFRLILK